MTVNFIASTTLSALTIIVAIIALFQTNRQVKISNKQHLFDQRVENYNISSGLIQLYKDNASLLKKEDRPFSRNSYVFSLLTNNTYLEYIYPIIENPKDEPKRREFLSKLEEVSVVETRARLLFSGQEADLLGDFIKSYHELLRAIYAYQVLLENMNNLRGPVLTMEQAQERVGEPAHRVYLHNSFDRIEAAYTAIQNYNGQDKIEKQIKLA